MSSSYKTVKQSRVFEVTSDYHSAFINHLNENNLLMNQRAYILNVGQDLIEPVNDDMVRVSIPYKKSANGYGVIILPKDNICMSDQKSEVERERLVDIDFGSCNNKLCVKYVDENGNPCETYESTRYIERYMNYTASVYQQGFYNGVRINDDIREKYNVPVPTCLKEYYIASKHIPDLLDYFSKYVTDGKLNYDLFTSDLKSGLDESKQLMINDKQSFIKNHTAIDVKSSNMTIFTRAYVSGLLDETYLKTVCAAYTVYPPEKGTQAYIDAERLAKGDSPVCSYFADVKQSFSRYNLQQSCSPVVHVHSEPTRQEQVEGFLDVDYDDDWLPFG